MPVYTKTYAHYFFVAVLPFIHPSIPANKSKEKAYGVVIGNDGYLPAKLRVRAGHK